MNNDDKRSINDYLSNQEDLKFLPVRTSKNLKGFKTEFNFENKDRVRKFTFKSNGKNLTCLVIIDKEGNYAVRKLITENTCCVVNGKHRDLTHYVISHIWGQAIDPRYFTNFWNILLVPSYANPFLEKNYDDEEEHPGAKLLNTIKAVMYKFYNFESLDWNSLNMETPKFNKNVVIPNSYQLQYLAFKPFDSLALSNNPELKNYPISGLEKIKNMENQEFEEEIKKVRRRVPGWKRKPDQVNSKILGLFMELSDNGKNGIFLDVLFDEFETKYPEEISLFVRNYNQMKNISEKNHGKVFSEDEEKTVWLWEPVKEFIIETYSH